TYVPAVSCGPAQGIYSAQAVSYMTVDPLSSYGSYVCEAEFSQGDKKHDNRAINLASSNCLCEPKQDDSWNLAAAKTLGINLYSDQASVQAGDDLAKLENAVQRSIVWWNDALQAVGNPLRLSVSSTGNVPLRFLDFPPRSPVLAKYRTDTGENPPRWI